MTSDVPPKATGGSVERVLGQVISLSGILLFALQDAQELDAKNPMALWWSALVWLVIGLVVVNAALGAVLPLGYLRFHWAATPALTAVVLVGSFAAYQGNDPDGLYLWTWSMGSVTLSYLALWARPVVAIGVGVAFASRGRVKETMPPKAETGSQARARRKASSGSDPEAMPQGVVCFTMTQAQDSW